MIISLAQTTCYIQGMDFSQLKNIVWKEDNQYTAQSLNTGIASCGDTREEALANLREALELYFEDESIADVTPVQEPELVTV